MAHPVFRSGALTVVALAVAVSTSLPGGGRAMAETAASPSPRAPAAPRSVGDRLILTPKPGTLFHIQGHHRGEGPCPGKPRQPLRAAYRGRLEVVRSSSGALQVINSLDFPTYLAGLAEVPLSWPVAALEAQVIAARSYALDALRRGARRASKRGYDICASDQCQVFRGATVARGAFGERWLEAVKATEGEVLIHGGRVIQAFYFSTSDGRTRRSFPGGTTRPYLPSVDGEDDDAPLAKWTARVPFADLGPILDAAGYSRASRVRSVTPLSDGVRVTGASGNTTLTKAQLRSALNRKASCFNPDRYPGKGSATGSKLPQTVPSTSYTARVSSGTLVLTGSGWGHGVGMSQWGARSLAERGRSAVQILKHYYGPARVTTVTEPQRIRVLVAEGLSRVVITVDGDADVTSGTGSQIAPGETFEARSGKTMTVARATAGRFTSLLEVRPSTATATFAHGEKPVATFTTTRSARLTLEVRDADGKVVAELPEESRESGDHGFDLPITEAGDYEVTLVAFDGLDTVRSAPLRVSLLGAPSPPPAPGGDGSSLPLAIGAGGLTVLIAAAIWAVGRRRRGPAF